LAGRYFSPADDERPGVIVDERFASELWPGQSPVGRRLLLSPNGRPQWVDVVGVTAHVPVRDLRGGGLPQLWLAYAAKPYSALNVVVRGADAMRFAPAIERAVADLNPGRPVHDIRMLDDYV